MRFRCVTVAAFVCYHWICLSISLAHYLPPMGYTLGIVFLSVVWMCATEAQTVYIFTRIDDNSHTKIFSTDSMRLTWFHSVFWNKIRKKKLRLIKIPNRFHTNSKRYMIESALEKPTTTFVWHMLSMWLNGNLRFKYVPSIGKLHEKK